MKILYLCNKHQYGTKMSRVRFHGISAITKITDLEYSGKGWDNYDNTKSVQENIDKIYDEEQPDVVIAYKPLGLIDFKSIKPVKCMRYNEMWDVNLTTKEIVESGTELVICHHLNDMANYKHLPDVKFVNISHCAEQSIYKDYGLPKTTDVLLTGAVSRHYPFRARLRGIMLKELAGKARCKVLNHPGGDLRNVQGAILDGYAKELNQSKITLTCSSRYKYRLGKYVEIPMSGSLLAADLPNEGHSFLKQFMLVLNPKDTDEVIAKQILEYVHDDDKRNELIEKGIELNKFYTQEKYAEKFVDVCNSYGRWKWSKQHPGVICD